MVEVQLAKLKEETRCPMCFGKFLEMSGVLFEAPKPATAALVAPATVSPAGVGGSSNIPHRQQQNKTSILWMASKSGFFSD